jgi:DnaJ-class molecular chaperone
VSDYEYRVFQSLVALGRQVDVAVFHGPQPHEVVALVGFGQNCPSCDGRGGDDGGPGAWTCGTCGGDGRLRLLKSYKASRWLPCPKTHPNSGTEYERKGWR